MIARSKNEAEGSTTLNQMGISISKMTQLDTLGLSKSTIKRNRRQPKETGLIKRQQVSGR